MSAIEVKNLVKFYKIYQKEPGLSGSIKSLFFRKAEQVKAVDDISFNIEPAELVGFIGPNGAGKTTTLKCLSGLLYPTSGQVSVLGFKPWERKNEYLIQIAFIMGQKNQLWWDLPPIETFLLNKEIYGLNDEKYKKVLADLVELLEVGDLLKVPVKKLSLGQRMKCELIASLLHSPQVLFLDEPTIGLDVVMQQKLREFIRAYNQKYKATIILTSHYMGDVQALAKRVIIINHGKILFDGSLETLVKKHAPFKLITLILTKPLDRQKIQNLGTISKYYNNEVSLKVESNKTNKVAARLLQDFPVQDINIEDPPIEDVIRDVFQSKKV